MAFRTAARFLTGVVAPLAFFSAAHDAAAQSARALDVRAAQVSTGNGPIMSVNSWGYTNQPRMAGPKLAGTSASCVFSFAKTSSTAGTFADGDAGVKASCP